MLLLCVQYKVKDVFCTYVESFSTRYESHSDLPNKVTSCPLARSCLITCRPSVLSVPSEQPHIRKTFIFVYVYSTCSETAKSRAFFSTVSFPLLLSRFLWLYRSAQNNRTFSGFIFLSAEFCLVYPLFFQPINVETQKQVANGSVGWV